MLILFPRGGRRCCRGGTILLYGDLFLVALMYCCGKDQYDGGMDDNRLLYCDCGGDGDGDEEDLDDGDVRMRWSTVMKLSNFRSLL